MSRASIIAARGSGDARVEAAYRSQRRPCRRTPVRSATAALPAARPRSERRPPAGTRLSARLVDPVAAAGCVATVWRETKSSPLPQPEPHILATRPRPTSTDEKSAPARLRTSGGSRSAPPSCRRDRDVDRTIDTDAQLARTPASHTAGQLRQIPTPPPRPRRQPPTQLRPPPHRDHPRHAYTRRHAPTSNANRDEGKSRREDTPLPQTTTRPHRLHNPHKRASIAHRSTLTQASDQGPEAKPGARRLSRRPNQRSVLPQDDRARQGSALAQSITKQGRHGARPRPHSRSRGAPSLSGRVRSTPRYRDVT